MVIENKYEIGQIVYLKTDHDQLMRIIAMIKVSPSGICYMLCQGEKASDHYECEISEEVNMEIKVASM